MMVGRQKGSSAKFQIKENQTKLIYNIILFITVHKEPNTKLSK